MPELLDIRLMFIVRTRPGPLQSRRLCLFWCSCELVGQGRRMTWIAPRIERTTRIGDLAAVPERQMLEGWLNWHRETLLAKCAGLEPAQLARTTVEPSNLRGLAFSGQASDRLFHAAIRNFSYSAWTSRGGR
jgi:hypothetical protein